MTAPIMTIAAAAAAHYTIPEDGKGEVVKVADFRDEIDHVFRIVNVDFHACVGADEKARWVEIARRFTTKLRGMTCKRATAYDWRQREMALDQAATRITKALLG